MLFTADTGGESPGSCESRYERISRIIIYGILSIFLLASLTLQDGPGGLASEPKPPLVREERIEALQESVALDSATRKEVLRKESPQEKATEEGPKPDPPSASRNRGFAQGDIDLLAHLIYAEARGEPFEGQVAVGAVVLNRVHDLRFPGTVAGVIYEPDAFCTVRDGQINLQPDRLAYRAAGAAASGWDPTGGALYFYNPVRTTSMWIYSRPVLTVIGRHYFAA